MTSMVVENIQVRHLALTFSIFFVVEHT
jgi:hypothetical protein